MSIFVIFHNIIIMDKFGIKLPNLCTYTSHHLPQSIQKKSRAASHTQPSFCYKYILQRTNTSEKFLKGYCIISQTALQQVIQPFARVTTSSSKPLNLFAHPPPYTFANGHPKKKCAQRGLPSPNFFYKIHFIITTFFVLPGTSCAAGHLRYGIPISRTKKADTFNQ